MSAHSSFLVWKISWTEEPGGLQSMGSQRIGHNRSNLALGLPGVENVGKGPLSCDLITSFLVFIWLRRGFIAASGFLQLQGAGAPL